MIRKVCKRCGHQRAIEDFYLRRKGSAHRQAYCRHCMNEMRRTPKDTK